MKDKVIGLNEVERVGATKSPPTIKDSKELAGHMYLPYCCILLVLRLV